MRIDLPDDGIWSYRPIPNTRNKGDWQFTAIVLCYYRTWWGIYEHERALVSWEHWWPVDHIRSSGRTVSELQVLVLLWLVYNIHCICKRSDNAIVMQRYDVKEYICVSQNTLGLVPLINSYSLFCICNRTRYLHRRYLYWYAEYFQKLVMCTYRCRARP